MRHDRIFRRRILAALVAVAVALTSISSLPLVTTDAAAQKRPYTSWDYCQPYMNYCYQYHQCYINWCAGYQVDCRPAASWCNRCYAVVAGFLTRQYGAIPRICRGQRRY
jgi:hypothetical protein